ncbi:MAG: hypothetical protein ACTS6G_01935 [Candidatus Hodgkinia cicadicola]
MRSSCRNGLNRRRSLCRWDCLSISPNRYSITQIKHFLGYCGLLVRHDCVRLRSFDL